MVCPGWNYFHCKQSEHLFTKLRTKILPKAETAQHENPISNGNRKASGDHKNPHSSAPVQTQAFMNAIYQWIVAERSYRPGQEQTYGDLPMDYLLQMITSGDQVFKN